MAVTLVGTSNTGNDSNESSRAPAVPTGAAENDYAVVILTRWESSNPAVTLPPGFTAAGSQIVIENAKLNIYRKRLDAADTGSYNFSWSGSMWSHAHCFLWRGVKLTGDPIGTMIASWTGTAGTYGSLSFSTAFIPGLIWSTYNDSGGTHTPPTGFTEVIDFDCGAGAWRVPASSGTQTASGGTVSSSSNSIAVLIGLEPEAGGGGVPIEVTLNRATESDSGNSLGRMKHLPMARALETVASRTLTPSKIGILTKAFQSDVAGGLAPSKLVPFARADELDAARLLTPSKLVGFDRSIESDTAQTFTPSKVVDFDRATEVDVGRAFSIGTPVLVTLGRAIEVNVAQDFSLTKFLSLQRAAESNLSRPLTKSALWVLERAEETESANSLTVAGRVVLQRAVENDLARPMGPTPFQVVPLGRAIETDIAHEFSATKFVLLPRAEELVTSQVLDVHKVAVLARAIEFDIAREMGPPGTGLPVASDGTGQVLVASSRGEVVSLVKVDSGLVVVTVVADRGGRP